jgi:hypothetical protein
MLLSMSKFVGYGQVWSEQVYMFDPVWVKKFKMFYF